MRYTVKWKFGILILDLLLEKRLRQMLEQRLENRNIKPTAMRLLVLKQLVESGAALSLKDLEAKFERADKATLYRTLKTFEASKLIHSIEDGSGSVKYALCADECECEPQDQHIHFHCVDCGSHSHSSFTV